MEQNADQLLKRIQELERENEALKKSQFDITQAKELYLKIFEEFPALIWRSRLDKLCDYFNKTWLEFTGRTMEQEFGNGWAEGVHPEDFDFCLKTYVEAFDKRESFLMEYRMKNRYGEYRWIRDFGRPFYDLDDSFLGYIGSCYDITEIKENEMKLKELNATKDKFFSIIAHDLINPFSNILGFAELLNQKDESFNSTEREKITKRLFISAKNTFSLLENLLDWSRSQSDKIPFEPVRIDVAELTGEVTENMSPVAGYKNIRLRIAIEESTHVFADVNMLKAVLRNLISNAVKFSFPDSEIVISAEKLGEQAIISVCDCGTGIAPEKIEGLFSLTGNQSADGTMHEKGTGLGLLLCREFVEKQGGWIRAESETGKGSRFIFTLPLA
jgi:two-component system CheB/CheR fusion protein